MNKERLTQLAALLDMVPDEKYDQGKFVHNCGSPACALGWWAWANPDRWEIKGSFLWLIGSGSAAFVSDDAMVEFDLTKLEEAELFDVNGCGNAKTAKEAAAYIRAFIERKEVPGR